MGGFLKFEKMITPIFIQLIFWLGFIGSIIFGLFMIGYGIIAESGGFAQVFMGIFTMFLGPIVLRVYCEILIVIFKMQGALISIRDSLNGQGRGGSVQPSTPTRATTPPPVQTQPTQPSQAHSIPAQATTKTTHSTPESTTTSTAPPAPEQDDLL